MAPAPVVQQPEHRKVRRTAEVIGADRVLPATAAPKYFAPSGRYLSRERRKGVSMEEPLVEASPRLKARLAGLFQLLESMMSAFGQVYLLGTFVVTRDPAATAANILANETLFQIGFAASLVAVGFHLVRTLFIYELFKIVNRSLSLFAVFVILVGCAIQALTSLFYLAPLIVLRGVNSALTAEQVQELAYVFIRLNAQTFNIYMRISS